MNYPRLAILAFGILFFIPMLGTTHLFDWDEINFAECAREMMVTGDYSTVQINYQPFWEKPPVFIWMQVLSMKIFGINEFGARFPNAVAGIITLMVLFAAGKRLKNERLGWWWVMLYAGSLLPHLYFKSGIIDPWFNLFIFLSFYRFYLASTLQQAEHPLKEYALAGLFLGLAVMTKGPVAILIAGMSLFIFWAFHRFRKLFSISGILMLILFTALSGGIWFMMLIAKGQAHIISDFIVYQIRLFSTQDAGHGGPFYYHFVILLIGCFPASIPAIGGLFYKNKEDAGFRLWMKIMFWVTLILFSIVKTKIVHYSSLCYFPLTYLAADYLFTISENKAFHWRKWMSITLLSIGAILGIVLTFIPFILKNKAQFLNEKTVKDPFALANLEADIHWSGAESMIGIMLLILVIIGFIFIQRQDLVKGFLSFSIGIVLTLIGASALLLPKIEGYSQRSAIEFYQGIKGKDVYLQPMGFKSYAYLFYSEKMPQKDPRHGDETWLCTGDIDKPAFLISKIQQKEHYSQLYPELNIIGEKNGFVFYYRPNRADKRNPDKLFIHPED